MSNLATPSRILGLSCVASISRPRGKLSRRRKALVSSRNTRERTCYVLKVTRCLRSRELNPGKLRDYTRERRAYSAELPTSSCKFLIVYRRFEILISRKSRARKHARSLSTSRDLLAGSPRDAALLILSSLSQRAARCQLSRI